ncbi:MAG: SDR family oxidoreductase [Chloroflexia bacterium]|nr:SDR family oxidoreductase [Chloroflexia bacterium]
MSSFHDKAVLITGGGGGIGRATALAFAEAGARLMLGDLDRAAAEETARLVAVAGGEAHVLQCDVAEPAQVEALVQATLDRLGRLDCAVNNAGIEASQEGLARLPLATWERTLAVNLSGVFYCMRAEITAMRTSGGGAIVNMASALGMVGFAGAAAYVAAKHGVIGLTKTAALEYATRGIRVNAVCPGFIATPMLDRAGVTTNPEREAMIADLHAMRRLGRPEEIAGAVLYLCSDAASFVTGEALVVDGGYTAR